MTPEERQAKIEALRKLRDSNFYEPETDNPENLPLDEDKPEVTMQSDTTNLENALKGTNRRKMLDDILKNSR